MVTDVRLFKIAGGLASLIISLSLFLPTKPTEAGYQGNRECVRIFAHPHKRLSLEEAKTFARRYDVLVLSSGNRDVVKSMKAVNPQLRVLLYHLAAGVWPKGADWPIYDNNESWFVHDSNGRRIMFKYGEWYLLDVANPGYQRFVIDRILENAARFGYDGVYLDRAGFDLETTTDNEWTSPVPPAKRTSWHRDVAQFLKAVKDGIDRLFLLYNTMESTAAGYAASSDSDHLQLVDGMNMEGFAHPDWYDGDKYLKEVDWLYQAERVKEAVREGKQFFGQAGIDAATTTKEQTWKIKTFALATYLLLTDCRNVYMTFLQDNRPEMDEPVYIYRYKLPTGLPVGGMYDAGGIFQRDFANAKVFVNPSDTQTRAVKLSKPMFTRQGDSISSFELEPKESLILLKTP